MVDLRIILILALMYFTYQVLITWYTTIKLLLKSEEFRIEKKEKLYGLGFLITLVLGWAYFEQQDVLLGLQLGLFVTLLWGLLIIVINFIFKLENLFSRYHQQIEDINSTGFKIIKGAKSKQYYWRDIKWIKFDKNKFRITLRHTHKVVVDKKTHHFYLLLKSIPSGFNDFDYSYVNSFFSSLTTCIICGKIALHDSECLSCGCSEWNKNHQKVFLDRTDYLKTNQLDVFATMEKSEKFSDFKINDICFDSDLGWTPMVTKEEVLEYSKKEYW